MEASEKNPLIVSFDNTIPSDVCEDMISRFERDNRKQDGVVSGGYQPDVKQSTDLVITNLEEWKDIDEILFDTLSTHLDLYHKYSLTLLKDSAEPFNRNISDMGYQIQRTIPGGFYTWHDDSMVYLNPDTQTIQHRLLTYLWYLNDVEEGFTEFCGGERIQPTEGKLLLFPATWPYVHRGTPPKSLKYICTGWLVENIFVGE